MLTKPALMREFQQQPEKHWKVPLFDQEGFSRRVCARCGKHFWTLDPDRVSCADSSCEPYGFIGKPVAKKSWDYVKAWKEFEKFFVKEGHASVGRYPVVDRWRPDLYYTIASIQDFQRIDAGSVVMEFPADPLIVPQVCLRFSDIDNVGVTGRHHTSFIMGGQHSFGRYWKDQCIDLNFRFLTEVMGIPPAELVYMEDLWAMPDFSQFGPSLETVSRGLELVNSVFSQFTRRGQGFAELPQKVIDVGWGHERLVWFSQGTATGYDAVFGPVLEGMRKSSGLKAPPLFARYAALAGRIDYDEARHAREAKEQIARELGVPLTELAAAVEPQQALAAIADHAKTLLFAAADGGIPSNVGGGYNLRVILRRALAFIEQHQLPFTLPEVAARHARHLKKLFPELEAALPLLGRIVEVEADRYRKTLQKADAILQKELARGVTDQALLKLYTSHGIAPQMVEAAAAKRGQSVRVPEDFYQRVTALHLSGEKVEKGLDVDVTGFPATRKLYYEDAMNQQMDAHVLGMVGSWAILDRTVFYPEGGGQPGDVGTLMADGDTRPVTDTQKVQDVILHQVSGSLPVGATVRGAIDGERRQQLMRAHDATHILVGAARKVIGPHAWQAGAQKAVDVSRLDLAHFLPFTREEVAQIEAVANDVVAKALPMTAEVLPRSEAEGRYGFVIYQGGASPGKEVRIVTIPGHDVEACGGTHHHNTREVGLIKIIRTERIQDGVNRLEFAVGRRAEAFIKEMQDLHAAVTRLLAPRGIPGIAFDLDDLREAAAVFAVEPRFLPQTVEKFLTGTDAKLTGASLHDACASLFAAWKSGEKQRAQKGQERSKTVAASLVGKGDRIREVVSGTREDLIQIAAEILKQRPTATVILANQVGDLVGMSQSEDMNKTIRDLCHQAGGSGGGRKDFAQGKVEISKLHKLLGS